MIAIILMLEKIIMVPPRTVVPIVLLRKKNVIKPVANKSAINNNCNNNNVNNKGGNTSTRSCKKDDKAATPAKKRHNVAESELNSPDIAGATFSSGNRKIEEVYGEPIHENGGSQIHGGIGGIDKAHQGLLKKLIIFNHDTYNLPLACSKRFVNGFIEILDSIGPVWREINSEFLLLYTLLVLYKVEDVNSNRDMCALLKRRMDCFNKISSDPQYLYKMVSEAESYFKQRRSKLCGTSDDNDIAKKFAKML